jgi:hypothetical protein
MGMCVPVLGAGGQHSNLIPDENTLFCTATLTLDLKFLEASARYQKNSNNFFRMIRLNVLKITF